MNTFGNKLRLTTFGESHGPAVGGVIDGFPAGVRLDFDALRQALDERKPGGKNRSPRKEEDIPEFISGISEEGVTLGSPITFIIRNRDIRSKDYNNLKDAFRPNHADYTYEAKYGIRDHRGGGRSSARETVSRVVAGALAGQLLRERGIEIRAFLCGAGSVEDNDVMQKLAKTPELAKSYSPSEELSERIEVEIEHARLEGDSVGGKVVCIITGLPAGVGEPVYDKLSAKLAEAMMGINAAKGFEIGGGSDLATKRGSEVVDAFYKNDDGNILASANFSGGIQGGISNGMPVFFRVSFKPTPTIGKPLPLLKRDGNVEESVVAGRHDPCVALRAVPVVKAMASLTIANFI